MAGNKLDILDTMKNSGKYHDYRPAAISRLSFGTNEGGEIRNSHAIMIGIAADGKWVEQQLLPHLHHVYWLSVVASRIFFPFPVAEGRRLPTIDPTAHWLPPYFFLYNPDSRAAEFKRQQLVEASASAAVAHCWPVLSNEGRKGGLNLITLLFCCL
jgi:hypothetical protein